MNKIIFKLPKTFYSAQNKKYITYFFIYLLLLVNLLLIHKYNIFVGDDAYLLTFLNNFNFLDKKYSILCEYSPDNQILIKTISPLYKIYYGSGLSLINFFNLELIWIRIFSYLIFLISFIYFFKISKHSKCNFYFIIIFLTLEPYIVMSHSIRHDIIIFLGIILFFYSINYKKNFCLKKNLSLFLSWTLLITHPSGYPFIIVSILFEIFFRKKNFFYASVYGILILIVYLYLKNFLKIEEINSLINLFYTDNVNILKEPAFTLEKFKEYFWNAKYKRHLFEILIFAIYLINFLFFKKIDSENKFILLIPFIIIIIFYFLNYFNVSYLKHIYLICILCTILVSRKVIYNKFIKNIIIASSFIFLIIFSSIAAIFLPHNTWTNLYSNSEKINIHISKNKIISAPFYILFFDVNINYIPINSLGNNNILCFPENIDPRKIDTIILDTQILEKIKNNDAQFQYLNFHLKNFKLVEVVYIGRLATQNIQKKGYIYIYSKI